jgi:poly(A)-specific ribonuclease
MLSNSLVQCSKIFILYGCLDFQEILTELDDVLKDATFLAIDGEFTGLNSGPEGNAYDTPSQYYAKLRTGSMDFLLVQFGLSVFTYNSKTNKYVFSFLFRSTFSN